MSIVRQVIRRFWRKETGQDLAEYCLITALVALAGLGIFYKVSGGMQDLWGTANSALATGNSTSQGAAAASAADHQHHDSE